MISLNGPLRRLNSFSKKSVALVGISLLTLLPAVLPARSEENGVTSKADPILQAEESSAKPRSLDYHWLTNHLRTDHPRLFISKENIGSVKQRAIDSERETMALIQGRIDDLLDKEIVFKDLAIPDGSKSRDHEYGFRASESALLYLVTGKQKYFDYTKKLLIALTDYYKARTRAGLNIHWFAFSRINTLCAFDWIYSDLEDGERKEIGGALLEAMNDMIWDGSREKFPRENHSDYRTGFYGGTSLAWYTGIVFYQTGINDALSQKLWKRGFDDYAKLLQHRRAIAGDQGGAASGAIGYSLVQYPWAEFNFFHTFQSSTGYSPAAEWPYIPGFLYYVSWNWLPGNHEFGYGDSFHDDNRIPLKFTHLHVSQIEHFYSQKIPQVRKLADWIRAKAPKEENSPFPFTRLLLTNSGDTSPSQTQHDKSTTPISDPPSAMFFRNMGQIFMRSGSGFNDTYALFTADGILTNHRHYDNNHFVIYRNGFRALDTGTRPEPGQHLSHYYARTVAHNCILIRMPGETFPAYWGIPAQSEAAMPVPNDGGQNERLGSKVVAYSQTKEYVYIASDATQSYHQDKAGSVMRQFVYILPDLFVVFDKVRSLDPSYKKSWLLHTASEPQLVAENEFSEASDGGILFSRTLLPKNAALKKIGGPGKQFWSDGRNWPLPAVTKDDGTTRRTVPAEDEHPLYGQWRVEVSPAEPSLRDLFLHVIQVGDNSLKQMVSSQLTETEDRVGVSFRYHGKEYEITFLIADNQHGGRISVKQDGQAIVNEAFTREVASQPFPF